jgi:Cys-tRNA(Pro)/Cys-tRNA(Cys) deacylase
MSPASAKVSHLPCPTSMRIRAEDASECGVGFPGEEPLTQMPGADPSGSEQPVPPVSKALRAMGFDHRVFRHPGTVATLEQAAKERNQRPEQVVRSLVFRLSSGEFLMVLAPGPRQVSWKRLRQHLGERRLTLATAAEVLKMTGYRTGTVAPFGLPHAMRVLIDRSILLEVSVSIGSGVASTGIILNSADLMRALPEAELVDLYESTPRAGGALDRRPV